MIVLYHCLASTEAAEPVPPTLHIVYILWLQSTDGYSKDINIYIYSILFYPNCIGGIHSALDMTNT